MASRLSVLRQRILLTSVALFIFVSVSSAERPRCYWCGPLAEQVHRSQRAPSCDTFHIEPHETVCDPGYSHCAIVAVSPPYAESRLCVKFYQDECYSLYCNSTKTWRMVCACQGDLCNGPHTEREKQAFALVPKFAKNKSREKRNIVSNFISVKTRNPASEDTVVIMSKYNDTEISDQPLELGDNITKPITPTPKRDEDNFMIVHGSLINNEKITHEPSKTGSHDETMKQDVNPTVPNVEEKHVNTASTDTKTKDAKMEAHGNGTKMAHDDSKMDKMNNTEVNKAITYVGINQTTTSVAEIYKESHDSTPIATTSVNPTLGIAVEGQTSATAVKMPPAEALQQNVTPTKALEVTTMGTVATSTDDNRIMETTTLPSEVNKDNMKKKNGGPQNLAHNLILVICIIVHGCV